MAQTFAQLEQIVVVVATIAEVIKICPNCRKIQYLFNVLRSLIGPICIDIFLRNKSKQYITHN